MDLKSKNNLKKNIFIKTFGCQMNEYDSNRILDITKKINYYPTKNRSKADCLIINTCHIREKATDKVFHDIGRIKKEFSQKRKPILIIAGCVAQAEGDLLLRKEKYVDAVVGPQSYHKINEIIMSIEKNNETIEKTDFAVIEKFNFLNSIENSNKKISTPLTIQEGCDKFCKFCVVPYTRGPEHSRDFDEIISEANHLVSNGVREITLLGQNVNAYERDNKKISDLIKKLEDIKKLKRIRYTTSHPKDLTDDLIEAHKNCEKLMPVLHLPVQSGSDSILKKMNRKHTIKEYLEKIEKLKKIKSNIQFTSDFIIGYPGETDNDFLLSCELLKKIKFINVYSYIFSPRPGTPADNLNLIDHLIAKNRLYIFQNIASEIKENYKKDLINIKTKTLFENEISKNKYFGRDEYMKPVVVESKIDIVGQIKNVLISDFSKQTIYGKISKEEKNIAA